MGSSRCDAFSVSGGLPREAAAREPGNDTGWPSADAGFSLGMPSLIGKAPHSPFPLTPAFRFVATMLALGGPAIADAAVDLTGSFRAEIATPLVPGAVLPCTFDFTQSGSALTGSVSCSILPPLPFTGTINTLLGIFSLSGSDPVVCSTLSVTGLAAQNSSLLGLTWCSRRRGAAGRQRHRQPVRQRHHGCR